MNINGIGAATYQATGCTAKKAEKNAESGAVGFMETAAERIKQEKTEQGKSADHDEQAFEMVGPHAPQNVKNAWMEAAKEVYANGAGIGKDGMMSHISQMMVQRCNKMLRGEADYSDILGSTVGSAVRATKQALYDLDHPLAPAHRSMEAQQARVKERQFYVAFLEKLKSIQPT